MREVRAHCANLLKRAILTMAATPDRERRFLNGYKSSMPDAAMSPADRQAAFGLDAVIEAAREAQEIQARRAARFKPTALDIDRCLPVLEWLTWLGYRNDGQKEAKIITAWAHGVPLWRLAQRFGCSDDTVRRWLNGAIAAVAIKFRDEVESMM